MEEPLNRYLVKYLFSLYVNSTIPGHRAMNNVLECLVSFLHHSLVAAVDNIFHVLSPTALRNSRVNDQHILVMLPTY